MSETISNPADPGDSTRQRPTIHRSTSRCPDCGYALVEATASTRCPECGLELKEILFQAKASVDLTPLKNQFFALAYGALAITVSMGFYYGTVTAKTAFHAIVFGTGALVALDMISMWVAHRLRRDLYEFWLMSDGVILHSPTGRVTRRSWADLRSAVITDRHPREDTALRRVVRFVRSMPTPEDHPCCSMRFHQPRGRGLTQLPLRVIVLIPDGYRGELAERLWKIQH